MFLSQPTLDKRSKVISLFMCRPCHSSRSRIEVAASGHLSCHCFAPPGPTARCPRPPVDGTKPACGPATGVDAAHHEAALTRCSLRTIVAGCIPLTILESVTGR